MYTYGYLTASPREDPVKFQRPLGGSCKAIKREIQLRRFGICLAAWRPHTISKFECLAYATFLDFRFVMFSFALLTLPNDIALRCAFNFLIALLEQRLLHLGSLRDVFGEVCGSLTPAMVRTDVGQLQRVAKATVKMVCSHEQRLRRNNFDPKPHTHPTHEIPPQAKP